MSFSVALREIETCFQGVVPSFLATVFVLARSMT